MSKLVKIRLKGSGKIIEVIPPVAIARVNGGTAEFIFPMGQEPETAALEGAPEKAVSKQQNPPKRKK
jgi:hypothetical protein